VTCMTATRLLQLVITVSLWGLRNGALLSRSATTPCTLTAHPTEACQLSSDPTALGYPDMDIKRGRVPMLLGESNCTVDLLDCMPGLCYSFQNIGYLETPLDPQVFRVCDSDYCQYEGNANTQPPSFYSVFADIKAISGAKSSYFSREGFSFTSDARTVRIQYSSHTCADYYALRGRAEMQLCRKPVQAMTELTVGIAISLPCSCDDSPSCLESLPGLS